MEQTKNMPQQYKILYRGGEGEIVEKKSLSLPKKITNVIRCRNPRCITSLEPGLDHVFVLTDPVHETYRCRYCEEKYDNR